VASPAVPATWWRSAEARKATGWRGVEAQHIIATLRLVDTPAEQQALEQWLEDSKPPLPPDVVPKQHYLLTTPFRYRSPVASRFRDAQDGCIWYGAEDRETACAELAFWRWRFLVDTEASLGGEVLTTHTLFAANVSGTAIDLSAPPWSRARARWTTNDYGACQQLARECPERDVAWIRYESARRAGGFCSAVFTPAVLAFRGGSEQTWQCKTTPMRVLMIHDDESLVFEASEWASDAPV
jgi:RES domain